MQKSFIEVQFPVSKVSKESYKERKANLGQTLTGLGKWWGRKPLILVRATILGLLLPATENPQKDREIFLKILSMDDDGLWQRKDKSISLKELVASATNDEVSKYFEVENDKFCWKGRTSNQDKQQFQHTVFSRMSYDDQLRYCIRPEQLEHLSQVSWQEINDYLYTSASNLTELIQQLSIKKYGEIITVGDCFCGGGSVPFEAARIGLNAFGSDLNPIATLLTWAALNINGASDEEIKKLKRFQQKVYDDADQQILDWEIETNEQGWRANSYLYCIETKCPACGWSIPLAPSWVIGKGSKTIAILSPNEQDQSYDIQIKSGANIEDLAGADEHKTVEDSSLKCPHCRTVTPITSIRKDRRGDGGSNTNGLRMWKKEEYIPRKDDVFQERLYCIRYEDEKGRRFYTTPTKEDLLREEKVISILSERFSEWQQQGCIPADRIQSGYNTDQPIRERGWQYWHQLFNPRQLLITGLLMKTIFDNATSKNEQVVGLLGVNKCADWSSKISIWLSAWDKTTNTFTNQALNTLFNYGTRSLIGLQRSWFFDFHNSVIKTDSNSQLLDAKTANSICHYWVTDPPYADAVNYHELSEFFLAWDKKLLQKTFPEWYTDSRRNEAIKGSGQSFTQSMIDVYKNLTAHMPNDGMQVVMFTHQDPAVWAELTLILWSAGLRVTAAWNIATETESGGLKSGNYVKGTVLMVLRKNASDESGWLDDIYPQIKTEVKAQIFSMQDLDNKAEPDFTDNDYLLAAYAASLKVLTKYKKIGDIDIEYEISKKREKNGKNPIQDIIESAVKIAYDYLIPKVISRGVWKDLTSQEKFYIKGMDFERNGITVLSAYQELARGLGINDYTSLLGSTKANKARVKTPKEFSNININVSDPFSQSLVRNILMALYLSQKTEDPNSGKNWLRNELADYWSNRNKIIELLGMFTAFKNVSDTPHWVEAAKYAEYLQSLVKNDGL